MDPRSPAERGAGAEAIGSRQGGELALQQRGEGTHVVLIPRALRPAPPGPPCSTWNIVGGRDCVRVKGRPPPGCSTWNIAGPVGREPHLHEGPPPPQIYGRRRSPGHGVGGRERKDAAAGADEARAERQPIRGGKGGAGEGEIEADRLRFGERLAAHGPKTDSVGQPELPDSGPQERPLLGHGLT